MDIVLLGSGNVATHLKNTLFQIKDVTIKQWYSRSFMDDFSMEGIPITASLSTIKKADLYLLAVSDDAIPEVSAQLPQGAFAVHTAGSVPLSSLENKGTKGVFYPLQTFSKNRPVNFSEIPICLEADSSEGMLCLQELGKLFNAPIHLLDSPKRLAFHVAAVFANNFTNHLYKVASDICLQKNISFELLHPLILETAHKIKVLSPMEAQTGPAKRNDKKSLTKHLDALENKAQQNLYSILTKAIQEHEQ